MPFELDRRTRRDEDCRRISPELFFTDQFPQLAARHGDLVAAGMRDLWARPLMLRIDGSAWSVESNGYSVHAHRGETSGALVLSLTGDQFSDWVQNQVTLNGSIVARALNFDEADRVNISVWDSLWIALLEGWPVIKDSLTFLDRHGNPLSLTTSFAPQDDPADIAHFLREAGYVHLKGWLSAADMRQIIADMDRALPHYHEGDGKSWWATLADGKRVCVRMQEFVEYSDTTARILSDARWGYLRGVLAAGDQLAEVPVKGRIIEALYKPIGIVSGPSDVSFHRDCHLGRHAYVCSRMTVGIALTSTNHANGSLRVVAGSHRLAMPVEIAKTASYLPVIALPTESGDLTVHLSCTLHESTPPVTMERRVMCAEIPQAPLPGASGQVDTSVGHIRERISDILRDEIKNGA